MKNAAKKRMLSADEIDAAISARSLGNLKVYDGLSHQGMFSLPKYIRTEFDQQTKLITDQEPLFIYQAKQ